MPNETSPPGVPGSPVRKRLLSTPLFAVEHREYPGPDGAVIGRDVVVHPGAVVILPILADGRIVLIRNYRYTVERELWELPAGTREPDETPAETARRELEEETGYRADSVQPLVTFYTSPGVLTERMHAFVATGLVHVGQKLMADEKIKVSPIASSEARRMFVEGEFADGKTIAVLGMYFAKSHA